MAYDRLSDYQFHLPEERIAQTPAEPRDHSRLLVYRRSDGSITDAHFYELPKFLPPEVIIVTNNSRVEKSRMRFGNIEVFEVDRIDAFTSDAMVRPGKKFKPGNTVALTDQISATVEMTHPDGLRRISWNLPLDDPRIEAHRETPFPPYIKADESLAGQYQTVFAKDPGSKAAPTAGLHFTPELMETLRNSGHSFAEVTLHVGLGTFAPVKSEHISEHVMHSESYYITAQSASLLNLKRPKVAVGTTSVRVLESAFSADGYREKRGSTDIFIHPGYTFKGVDALITNFHLPGSTLLMLVSALAGYDETRRIYAHAIAEEYRFFSFGDAMLIL